MTLYGGAGDCDLSKGYNAGTVYWSYGIDGTFEASYVDSTGYGLQEAQIYVGAAKVPMGSSGSPSVAPGDYGNIQNSATIRKGTSFKFQVAGAPEPIYIIAHANSCSL